MTRSQSRTQAIKALIAEGFFLVADLPKHKRMVWTAPVVELKR